MTLTTQTMFVRPAPGLLVRQPDGKPLPAEGTTVPRTSYWMQMLRHGDIVESMPTPPSAAAPAKSKAKEA